MKIVILLALVAIVGALGGAGLFMLRRDSAGGTDRASRMAKALALRVGLSVALFVFILLAYLMGWIHPSGIPVSG